MGNDFFATFGLILTIGAIIQVITVVVFFVLANNVAKIRCSIAPDGTSYYKKAKMEEDLGNTELAINYYRHAQYCFKNGDRYNGNLALTKQILNKIDSKIDVLTNSISNN